MKLLVEQGPPVDLAGGLVEFLDAVDFAFEWLNREDPARDRAVRLAIFEARDGVSEEVWRYPSALPADGRELVEIFGFNPVAWKSGVRDFSAGEARTRLGHRLAATVPHADGVPASGGFARPSSASLEAAPSNADQGAEAERARSAAPSLAQSIVSLEQDAARTAYDSAVVDSTEHGTVRATAQKWIAAAARDAWNDPLSRCWLFFAVASLWLSLSLADPSLLVLLLVPLPGFWWRQRRRGAALPELDTEDWL